MCVDSIMPPLINARNKLNAIMCCCCCCLAMGGLFLGTCAVWWSRSIQIALSPTFKLINCWFYWLNKVQRDRLWISIPYTFVYIHVCECVYWSIEPCFRVLRKSIICGSVVACWMTLLHQQQQQSSEPLDISKNFVVNISSLIFTFWSTWVLKWVAKVFQGPQAVGTHFCVAVARYK